MTSSTTQPTSPTSNITRKHVLLWGLSNLVLGALLSLTFSVMADGDPTTDDVPRTFPYQGTLELDGQPFNARGDDALQIQFAFFDGQASEAPVYTQAIPVEVFAGRFTTTIGPIGQNAQGEDIVVTDIIQNADDLYLGMTILGDINDPEDDIALNNRQRIHATPYSMWTTSATNITVARDAVVGRNLTVAGNGQVNGSLGVTGDFGIGGDLTLPQGSIEFADLSNATINTIDERVKNYVRNNCTIQIGWRDGCNNGCSQGPSKNVTVRANRTCVGGLGTNPICNSNGFGRLNFDGDVNGDDTFFIRFDCTD